MNHTQAATPAGDFGCTLPGMIVALLVALLFAACAYALHAWPAETIRWSAFAVILLCAGASCLAPRLWFNR